MQDYQRQASGTSVFCRVVCTAESPSTPSCRPQHKAGVMVSQATASLPSKTWSTHSLTLVRGGKKKKTGHFTNDGPSNKRGGRIPHFQGQVWTLLNLDGTTVLGVCWCVYPSATVAGLPARGSDKVTRGGNAKSTVLPRS